MDSIKVLTVASNFPDLYYLNIAPWSKNQVDAIFTHTNVKIEVVVPRPYAIPLKVLPYYKFAFLPMKIHSDAGYVLHFPRFPFPIPKKMFFHLTGDLYSIFISKYVLTNIDKPDLIHARFIYLDGYGMMKTCKKWNIPLVFDIHGSVEFEKYYYSQFLSEKLKKTIRFTKKILCVAHWQVKKALEMGIPEEKLECIPLGVDIDKFKPRDKEKIREEFKIDGHKVILFVGQLNNEKGIDYLLHAISLLILNSKQNDIRLVIIGDGVKKEYLMSLSKKLGIQELIIFTGHISGESLAKWYSLADLFVLPSLVEGRPSVINEAMASECAVIASNISGIPEQVKDGYNGFLVEPRDAKILAEKIGYFLQNEGEIVRMGKNGRKHIIDEGWTWDGYAHKVQAVYKEVI